MSDLTALRSDVALANRIIERLGLSNAFGHVSARIPGTETFLLPTPRSPAFAEADGLLIFDTDGTVLSGIGQPHRIVHNQGGAFVDGVAEYGRVGLIRTRELGDLLAQQLGPCLAVMMR